MARVQPLPKQESLETASDTGGFQRVRDRSVGERGSREDAERNAYLGRNDQAESLDVGLIPIWETPGWRRFWAKLLRRHQVIEEMDQAEAKRQAWLDSLERRRITIESRWSQPPPE